MTIIETMEQEVEAMTKIGFPREQNLKAAVLKHGRAYELDREASAAMEKGKLKECFANAGRLALFDDKYTYVEGFAHSGWGMIVSHAWVVNAEGKALELTWRDGGDKCGFCDGGDATCFWCKGTGKNDDEHRSLEDAEYFGIEVDAETLRDIVLKRQVWGVLNTREDLDMILAAREAEAA